MVIRSRIEPIDRDIDLLLNKEFSEAARSERLAEFAREQRSDADRINRSAFGYLPAADVFVDGVDGASLDRVRADGVIVFAFDLLSEMLAWIDFLLLMHSPVKSGRYKRSHVLFMDGVEVDPVTPHLEGRVFVYTNTQPYARKIERGLSKQAPDGVFQSVAALGAKRFGNVARFTFSYTSIAGGGRQERQPCIVVTVG
jgi:hypothetical protein